LYLKLVNKEYKEQLRENKAEKKLVRKSFSGRFGGEIRNRLIRMALAKACFPEVDAIQLKQQLRWQYSTIVSTRLHKTSFNQRSGWSSSGKN